ncbi:uncharacterized protein LOC132788313 [Drosophila nasuta]|uniref:uncharacterized protein LOC132788313 n=1 Tax=Drosophila nasuta TaxID=42062 RepID=UPI00295E6EE3|nr:uncharacterized protein LOC132788313 [Drosophila nasuta]
MHLLELVFNLVLVGSSGYGLYALTPTDQPYGYTAAAFCFVHGLLGLVRNVQSQGAECSRSFFVSTSIVDVLPLPLANIEFYLQSSQSGLAMVHAMSLILLIYDTMGNLGDDWDAATETVKDLSLVANVASATYLGLQEENYFHVGIAVSATIARYGSALVSTFLPEFGPHVDKMSKSAIIGLMTYSLTQK